MSDLRQSAKIFDADDVSWIHDGAKTEPELIARGDEYMRFLFDPFPDLRLPEGFRALEIGSGIGYIMQALERYTSAKQIRAQQIIGLDIAANMIAKARARLNILPFEFLHYDGIHIPLTDSSLDFVYSVAALQHIPKPFVYNLFFEIKRLLTAVGFSLLHFIDVSHIPHCIVPWRAVVDAQITGAETGWLHFYSADELRWVLGAGTGFSEVRVVPIGESLTVAIRQ